ncbi:hypothetical protein QWY85_13965 [Neolewinella lacunae]|uniref:Uncharacterized protein n=1 Tax=Neolewinella lacunae TaxID=1517758 RepID=A0A923TBU0_9BACT|nr:hypothetical protein [Neolewinella lacunae]MBC6992982.1 hypothetical protein [Neolewinella lacunae]MDN3635771.1 hypothetical protein [Neolewinella lacunae]
MVSQDSLITLLSMLVGPAILAFGLIVCVIAHQRHRSSGTVLMLIGSTMVLLQSLFWVYANFTGLFSYSGEFDARTLGIFAGIINTVGQICFFVGLLKLVNYVRSKDSLSW